MKVVVALREPFQAHARSDTNKRVRGETTPDFVDQIERCFKRHVDMRTVGRTRVLFSKGAFTKMTVREQLLLVSTADVFAGAHGAGLSWIFAIHAFH